jgi:hypothetical protein
MSTPADDTFLRELEVDVRRLTSSRPSTPLAAAREIRETFHRRAMNDEETLALIVGGHTFGKAHGAAGLACVGPAPASAPVEQQGLGWKNSHGTGHGPDTVASGIEGAWTSQPTRWDSEFLLPHSRIKLGTARCVFGFPVAGAARFCADRDSSVTKRVIERLYAQCRLACRGRVS